MDPISPFEPTVLGATWRYRWLALAVVVVFGSLGYLFVATQSSEEEWTATATVIVEDPSASTLFEVGGVLRPERYLENQVEILRSDVVAQRAAELAAQGNPPASLLVGEFLGNTKIASSSTSDAIAITFRGKTESAALAGANAVADAYQDVRRSEAARNFAQSIAQLDASIDESETELSEKQLEIDELLLGTTARRELEAQFEEALVELVRLQEARSRADADAVDIVRGNLDDLLQQVQTLQAVLSVERSSTQLDVLIAEQQAAVARLAVLTERRDELEVDSRLAGSGVVLYSPAVTAVLVGSSAIRPLAAALVLGALVAGGLAYALALRRRVFSEHAEPELVLGVPMLAEVPQFKEERLKTQLPVRDQPFSAAAESFRFVAGALQRHIGAEVPEQMKNRRFSTAGLLRSLAVRSLAVASSLPGEGKSTVAANVAVSLAREGNNVLVVDADFGDQRVSRILGHEIPGSRGLTEIVSGDAELAGSVVEVELGDGVRLALLARGEVPTAAADLLRSDSARSFFAGVRSRYDVIIVDTPPLLHVAYAGTLLGYADAALAVVPHGGSVSVAEEFRDRLELIDTPLLGYVYNKAPLRRKFSPSAGSMKDVAGTGRSATDK